MCRCVLGGDTCSWFYRISTSSVKYEAMPFEHLREVVAGSCRGLEENWIFGITVEKNGEESLPCKIIITKVMNYYT